MQFFEELPESTKEYAIKRSLAVHKYIINELHQHAKDKRHVPRLHLDLNPRKNVRDYLLYQAVLLQDVSGDLVE